MKKYIVSNGNVLRYITIGVCENGYILQETGNKRIFVYSDLGSLKEGLDLMVRDKALQDAFDKIDRKVI